MSTAQEAERHAYSVDVVTEALVREHLTKKKYAATLEAFRSEQPQLKHSISKRSVLHQLLDLNAATAAAAEVQGKPSSSSSSSSSSTLELWVQQQLQGKACTRSNKAPQKLPCNLYDSDHTPSTSSTNGAGIYHAAGSCDIDSKQSEHMRVQRPGSQGTISSTTASSGAQTMVTVQGAAAAGKLPASRLPGRHSATPAAAGSSSVPGFAAAGNQPGASTAQPASLPGSWQAGTSALPDAASSLHLQQQQQQQQLIQQPPRGQDPSPTPPAFRSAAAPAPNTAFAGTEQQQLQGSRLAGLGPLRSSAVAAASSVAATVGPAAVSSRIRPSAALDQQLQKELVLEDMDDEDDVHSGEAATGGSCNSSSALPPSRLHGSSRVSSSGFAGHGVGSNLANLQPLLPEQQRQLSRLLWGDEAVKPDAAWQQGLVFADTPGLGWGLVQLAGGPCGVLAAVQAHLVATLMEQGLWGLVLQPERLQEALASSLATLLWAARGSGSSAKVVMLPLATGSAAARGMCDAAQAVRMAQVAPADSQQQLEVLVRAALPQWCQHKGWGLLLLLYSVLLTRGCGVVAGDMDEAGVPLVDGLGYCSMELVNLLLTGAACSNVFDGCRQFGCEDASDSASAAAVATQLQRQQQAGAAAEDSHVLMGVASQARVGLLTLFEWYRYVEVGHNLKSPRFPVWVVCSESHFSTLALAPHQQQHSSKSSSTGVAVASAGLSSSLQPAPGAAVELEYYDGMAKQEGPIHLQLLPAPGGVGWSSRMAGVAEDRGCWRGQIIPPLECVVETKWQDVAVTWQGSEPML